MGDGLQMASLLHSFDPPANGSAGQKATNVSDVSINDDGGKIHSLDISRQESSVLLGCKDANDDTPKRQVLCVRKTRSGGHKTYMATGNQLQMVYML
jgi:hypothetical protein